VEDLGAPWPEPDPLRFLPEKVRWPADWELAGIGPSA